MPRKLPNGGIDGIDRIDGLSGGAAGIFFFGPARRARRAANKSHKGPVLSEEMELIKLLVVYQVPKTCLHARKTPPFEAFFGPQKAPKVPKWLKKRPECRESSPMVELMELIELMVFRGGRRDFLFRAGATRATRGKQESQRPGFVGRDGIDKTIGRLSSPQNVLACTQNPPFEAFFGPQKAPKVPKWLKKRPECRESSPMVELMELIELMVFRGGRRDFFFRAGATRATRGKQESQRPGFVLPGANREIPGMAGGCLGAGRNAGQTLRDGSKVTSGRTI